MSEVDQWEQIIADLQGTCQSLNIVLDKHEAQELEDHMPFLDYLDNQIFCCERCNWWSELGEMADNDNWECRDCSTDEEE